MDELLRTLAYRQAALIKEMQNINEDMRERLRFLNQIADSAEAKDTAVNNEIEHAREKSHGWD
jgi:hypothetical protein